MQRPNMEDYKVSDGYSCKYIVDLGKYCDKLEDTQNTQHEVIELSKAVITELERRNTELERKNETLDKCCDELERKNEMCEKEVFAITQRVIKLEKALDKAIFEIRQLYNIDSHYCDRKENSHYKECDYECLKCERIKESILDEVQDE